VGKFINEMLLSVDMEKRGQLTTFVLVAIVVIVIIVFLAAIFVGRTKLSISNQSYVSKKTNEVRDVLNGCVGNAVAEGIKSVGLAELEDYMQNMGCDEEIRNIFDARLLGNKKIDTRIDNDNIGVDVDYGIEVGKDVDRAMIGKQSFTYPRRESINADEDGNDIVDSRAEASVAGGLAILEIARGTRVSNQDVGINVMGKEDAVQYSDIISIYPENKFRPTAKLKIYVDSCEDSDDEYGYDAIIDRNSGKAYKIECKEINGRVYAVAEIDKASDYFFGTCDDYDCPWKEEDDLGDDDGFGLDEF